MFWQIQLPATPKPAEQWRCDAHVYTVRYFRRARNDLWRRGRNSSRERLKSCALRYLSVADMEDEEGRFLVKRGVHGLPQSRTGHATLRAWRA
ncbi:hypothetical protein M8818_001770 [Zalaria obscura]|uniref:Uncharacterized protein n=1 Tax=Zalaria obscura TaxID=2024903 RepID=A0ACC3SMI0_9PEZI